MPTPRAAVIATLVAAAPALAAPPAWDGLLSRRAIGADRLQAAHPTWDGRGVVVAVLDTGVDMGAPGLERLPDGQPKVVGVRDVSGQGTVRLHKARSVEQEGVPTLRAGDRFVRGATGLSPAPTGGLRLGELREDAMPSSSSADLNADGDTDDVFSIVAWEAAGASGSERWAVVDTDGDHDVADETPRRSYEVDHAAFTLQGYDPSRREAPLTMGLYLADGLGEAEVHFDDGGHGTHCAGIAAGHSIDGRPGYDGIAPGARVLSIKIGDNAGAGGATTTGAKKKAFEIAAEWAEDHGVPVVINLSYGIGSETEGQSDIDRLVDDTLAKHPTLYIATSAGNNGPGISSVGQPGGSAVAFTAGAALVREQARVMYGARPDSDRVFWFSSRGGELSKPDAILPGIAGSTVPPWMGSANVMRGTSMAAPQAAGAMAVMLSALAEGGKAPGTAVTQAVLRRALRYSAKPLEDATLLDQGGGLVDLPAAIELARRLTDSDEARRVLAWRATTTCPTCADGKGPGSFWRAGGFVPPKGDVQEVELRAVRLAPEGMTKKERGGLLVGFDVTADASWIDVVTDTVWARGEGPAKVRFSLRPDRLEEPGLHVASLRGVAEGGPSGRAGTAFEVPVVAIVPHVFDRSNGWSRAFSGNMEATEVERLFVRVPPSASTLFLDLTLADADGGSIDLHLFDPQGRAHGARATASASGKGRAEVRVDRDELAPGIWEVDLVALERNPEPLEWTLDARFTGLQASPVRVFTVPQGDAPEASAEVTNRFPRPFRGHGTGSIRGVSRRMLHDAAGDKLELPIKIDADTASLELELVLEESEYARFTDVAISLVDGTGKAVAQDGFSQAIAHFSASPPPGSYTVVVEAAGTADALESWSVEVEELYVARTPIPVTVELANARTFTLWPDVPGWLDLTLERRPLQPPDGMVHHGEVQLVSDEDEETWLTIPLRLEP